MSGIGSGIGDIFSGFGAFAQASGYSEAAKYSNQNAKIVGLSTKIQEQQNQRQIYQTISGQKADVAGAGFAASGSSLDLLRSSVQQGSLQMSLVANQGLIDKNSWLEKAAEESAQATASEIAGVGDIIGGVTNIAMSAGG